MWARRCAATVALAALTVLVATFGAAFGGPAAAAHARATDGTRGKIAGMGLSPAGSSPDAEAAELPRVRGLGINTGMVDVWWDVDSQDANSVHPGSRTTDDATLARMIQAGRAAGLSVFLEPKVTCPSCERRWRGLLQPSDRAAFFDSYRQMVNHYAALAEQNGVSVYYIGSEMSTLQNETDEWRQTATEVRGLFHGTLAYEVNWPDLTAVHYWDAVDLTSVSAYFPLSDDERPPIATLTSAWHGSQSTRLNSRGKDWYAALKTLAATSRHPILFGEAGYLSSTFAGSEPYNEGNQYELDQQLQADLYQSMLSTFENADWWLGVIWWEWQVSPKGEDSISFTPRDKKAEQLLHDWYVLGKRPAKPGESILGGPPSPAPSATGPHPSPSTGGTQPVPSASHPQGSGGGGGDGGSGSPDPRASPSATPVSSATPGVGPTGSTGSGAGHGPVGPQALRDLSAGRIALPEAPVPDDPRSLRLALGLVAGGVVAAGASGVLTLWRRPPLRRPDAH